MRELSRSWLAYAYVHIERDEMRMSRQARYMRQPSGHAQFEFTDDRFSRDAVHNATQQ